MIDAGARTYRREDAERNREQHGQGHRDTRELKGGRQPLGDRRRHRLVGAQRDAEIAPRSIFEKTAVLLSRRPAAPG